MIPIDQGAHIPADSFTIMEEEPKSFKKKELSFLITTLK